MSGSAARRARTTGSTRLQLLVSRNLGVTGPGRLAADVEQVRALGGHLTSPRPSAAATGSAEPVSRPSPLNESGVTLMMPIT